MYINLLIRNLPRAAAARMWTCYLICMRASYKFLNCAVKLELAIRKFVKIIIQQGNATGKNRLKMFSKNRNQPQSYSFLFFCEEDEAANVKALAIEVDFGTMPFNKEYEQRGLGAERGGARRKNNENEHHTSNETSSLNKKLSFKQPSLSSMNDLPPDSSKASLMPMNSRKSTDLVNQTPSTALAVAFQVQQHPPSIELARQAHR